MTVTVPSSTAPAVRRWLFNQLTAVLAPDPNNARASLLVCVDGPGPEQPDDIVSISGTARTFEKGSFVGNGGAGWLRERYTITVEIDVFRGGDDPLTVAERGQALADGVIAVVRSDLTLGGNVLISSPQSDDGAGEWDENHLGRHWTQTVTVSCFAQI
jgi:hypothetical protein